MNPSVIYYNSNHKIHYYIVYSCIQGENCHSFPLNHDYYLRKNCSLNFEGNRNIVLRREDSFERFSQYFLIRRYFKKYSIWSGYVNNSLIYIYRA